MADHQSLHAGFVRNGGIATDIGIGSRHAEKAFVDVILAEVVLCIGTGDGMGVLQDFTPDQDDLGIGIGKENVCDVGRVCHRKDVAFLFQIRSENLGGASSIDD